MKNKQPFLTKKYYLKCVLQHWIQYKLVLKNSLKREKIVSAHVSVVHVLYLLRC